MRKVLQAGTLEGEALVSDINAFCRAIRLDAATGGRHSILLMLDLYFGTVVHEHLNPAKVLAEIRALENPEAPTHTKPATAFTRPALRGLWHKHYLESGVPSLATNLIKGLHRYGIPSLERKIQEATEAGEERFMTKADVEELANEVTHHHFQRLAEEKRLTGEWIVFATHESKNYYLCLGKHNSGDSNLRAQIEAACFAEFPFLKDILTPQPSA